MVSAIKHSSVTPPLFLKVKKRSLFIQKTISNPFEFNSLNTVNFYEKLKKDKIEIQKAKVNCINILILKIINFVLKIFNKSYDGIDKLILLNNECNLILKKIHEITNLNKINYNKRENQNSENPLEISNIERNFYVICKIQDECLLNELKSLEKVLLKNDKKDSLNAFNDLPKCLKESLIKLAAIKNKKAFNDDVGLFIEKSADDDSVIQILQNYYKTQISNYDQLIKLESTAKNFKFEKKRLLDNYKREILFIDNLFKKFDKSTTIYDVSIDRIIPKISPTILEHGITITIVGAEYAGIVKQGGLAEAIEGLSTGLKKQNKENNIQVILPKYKPLPASIEDNMGDPLIHYTSKGESFNVYTQEINGVKIYFIDDPSFQLDSTLNIYGSDYPTLANRFATFSELAAEFIYTLKNCDVIHLHDWHVSGVALKLKKDHKEEWRNGEIPPIVFTYHNNNRNSQGRICIGPYSYDPVILGYQDKGITKNNENLFIKTLKIADAVTTVSENFAKESQSQFYGQGISFAVKKAAKLGKLIGIINGTDPNRWNPKTDLMLTNYIEVGSKKIIDLSYDVDDENLAIKRINAKRQLQKWINHFFPTVNIDLTKPLVTFIGRYDSLQKGLDKFEEAVKEILANGGQFLAIGTTPDKNAIKILNRLEKKYKKGVFILRDEKEPSGKLRYQDGNSKTTGVGPLIRASSDFIFIPSNFEPCGLTQFEGWLFGSLAIASNTGGLVDSIIPFSSDQEDYNGYLFDRNEKSSLKKVIKEALAHWCSLSEQDKGLLMSRIMKKGKTYTWTDSTEFSYSIIEKYRIVYANAKRNIAFRKEIKINKIDLLRYKISTPQNAEKEKLKLEESYLKKYYSKKYDSELLNLDYQKLPEAIKAQVPAPYGKNVLSNHYEKYGVFLNNHQATFRIFAPKAKNITLVLFDSEGVSQKKYSLKKENKKDWMISLPKINEGQTYYYLVNGKKKIDPYARSFVSFNKQKTKLPLSVITQSNYSWNDSCWITEREDQVGKSQPMSIYELHPGYWKRKNGENLNYREIAEELIAYCNEMGYSHVELMGILEYPTEASWGYQVMGYYAPTSRYGSLDDFKCMVDLLHQNKIGVILDWVPAHFAKDKFGLNNFDGTNLYNASGFKYSLSIRNNFFKYGSKHFDFKKKEVREFLYSSALYWLKEMHIDILRVDCVRSILESEDKKSAHLFLRELNAIIHNTMKGCTTTAEEYSGDREVTRALGYGFDRKWHSGWMHGTFDYFRKNYSKRKKNYDHLIKTIHCDNFSRQVMFISHDQVKSVDHGNLINLFSFSKTMHERFEHLRSMLTFMMCLPGKKLIFMGEDSGLSIPWDRYVNTRKGVCEDIDVTSSETKKTNQLIKILNKLYRSEKALHEFDDNGQSLEWIKDKNKIVHAYRRKSSIGESCVILHNFTDTNVDQFVIEFSKSDNVIIRTIFASNKDNFGQNEEEIITMKDNRYILNVPPLSTIILKETIISDL